ncbi:MAG TPA: hypothetical protein VEJ87_01820 [Acidimicrobiales bacterium]|nr:hypothetical protein [Acidimicrobiales bacterium]
MPDDIALFTATYSTVSNAVAGLANVERLHGEKMIGTFDAAVIDKENGKPRIVKRMDRPYSRVIPEVFGGGRLPRKELKDAANELTSDEAGLIVVGEPTIEKGVDEALKGAVKVIRHSLNATTDEIADELQEALKE